MSRDLASSMCVRECEHDSLYTRASAYHACSNDAHDQTHLRGQDSHLACSFPRRTVPKKSSPLTVLHGPYFELFYGQEGYPEQLMSIDRPPEVIRGVGDPRALEEGIAIVGARKATPYGLSSCEIFAEIASGAGIPIVSGGARGCDSQAHKAALKTCGKTVVVLGGGLNKLYPYENRLLFQEVIDKGGAVISEQDNNYPPKPYTFRARNRIIAGLARVLLIVEAGLPSGTFSTADDALNSGKSVWVVPGAITSPSSAGANQLIYQGAIPVISKELFQELLRDSFPFKEVSDTGVDKQLKIPGLNTYEHELYEILCASQYSFDDLCQACEQKQIRVARGDLFKILAGLELKDLIELFPDGRYGALFRS